MAFILRPVLRKLGLLFAALALFSVAGGHWAILQTVAWAEMLRDYAQRTGSLAVAVEQTFDGEHPCELCRKIDAGKAKQRKEGPAVPGVKDAAKVKAVVANAVLPPSIPPATLLARVVGPSPLRDNRTEPPPTPPPRGGTATA